ncbi:aspartic proteinase Asp1-like [Phalaenopsis equestris]|uniref:aspartic proteinase Asp1-like n=1 Tax=Phalaenopsis equestris TaxID=78828 RepID=UPI0009E226B8|nr:aspartic proteinase Asp1-like [Phalaenopsis equestris]
MGLGMSPLRQPIAMAALISAVLFAGLRSCCFADITPSSPSTSPRKPRSWPWRQPSPPDSHSPAAPNGIAGDRRALPTSAVFPVYGNVYPDGFYYVSMNIGDPPKPYFLDIDTGSDVTWLQCDAPCVKCSQGPHPLYRPRKNGLVPCKHPLCAALHESTNHEGGCEVAEQCDYEIEYQDHGSSIGVLVSDTFALRLTNSSLAHPVLSFGCGYDQQAGPSAGPNGRSDTDGVLGLGSGKVSILSQLSQLGICRSVVGHCLGRRSTGFMFFGENVVPPRSLTWAPMSHNAAHKYYSPGLAEVYAGKQQLGVKQAVVFDSGSSYTYFNDKLYHHLLSAISTEISKVKPMLKEAAEDKALPHCWKGTRPFKSVFDLRKHFRSLNLSFANGKAPAVLEIPPENYFIVTKQGNACLGILNGGEIGLGDLNLVGDISMQDVMIVYDNEKQRIGWARVAGCGRLPTFANSPL